MTQAVLRENVGQAPVGTSLLPTGVILQKLKLKLNAGDGGAAWRAGPPGGRAGQRLEPPSG